jgi:hypothetical protein
LIPVVLCFTFLVGWCILLHFIYKGSCGSIDLVWLARANKPPNIAQSFRLFLGDESVNS